MRAASDGATPVVDRCLNGRTRPRNDDSGKDEAGWAATVDRLLILGPELMATAREVVLEYLVATP